MKTALFYNFTKEAFTGYWDGKPKTIKAGQKIYMPEYLARHFAKHLANKLLIEKGQDSYTSPKFPEQVPAFMELFNKAFILEDDAEEQSQAELETDLANKSHEKPQQTPRTAVDNKPPQVIEVPDDEDEENNFEGLNEKEEDNG